MFSLWSLAHRDSVFHNKHAETAVRRQLTDSGMDCLKADATSGVRQRQSARRKRETQFVGLFQPTLGKRSVKLSITQKLSTPLIERLRKAKVHFRSDILTGPGGSEVVFDDPSGNPVELFQPAER